MSDTVSQYVHVSVGCGSEPLSCQANNVQSRGKLVEEPGVTCN